MTEQEFDKAFKTAGSCFLASCLQDIIEFDKGCGCDKQALYEQIAKHFTKNNVFAGECDERIAATRAIIKAGKHKEALEHIVGNKEIAEHRPDVCASAKNMLEKCFKNAKCEC